VQSQIQNWPAAIYDVFGLMGFGLYVLSYCLLTTHRLDSRTSTYFTINLVAAGLVLVSLIGAFNLASLLIQVFWIVVSILAIAKRYRIEGHHVGAATYRARYDPDSRLSEKADVSWSSES
jgi:predicted membrane protein